MGENNTEQNIITGDPLGLWGQQHPSEWQEYKLWDLAEYINGKAFKPTDFSLEGLPVIKITELKYGISPSTNLYSGQYEEKYLLNTGDLLFAWSGNPETSLDAFRWKDKKALLNQHIFRVIPRHNIDKTYLFFLFKYLRPSFIRTARDKATSMGHVKISDLKRLIAYIPPLPQQKAIASILGALDDKIELNRKMNETLEAMARAIFKSWFVDFNPIPGLGHHKEWQDSPLGKIPKGWRVGTLNDFCEIVMGQSPPGETYNKTGEGLPFYQGIRDFGFRFPSKRVYCTASTRLAQKGDVLLSVRAPVGSLNVAGEDCAIGRGVAALRIKEQHYGFLYYLMKETQWEWEKYEAEGTVFGSATKTNVQKFSVIFPSSQVITGFNETVLPIDQMISNNEKQSLTLASIRNALLPKLLSGAIRVKNAERFAERNR